APSGGTTMFAKLGSTISVDDLLHGVVVQSANDGCIVLAEGMAGSEGGFAKQMNDEGAALGLTDSHFTNSTGLPDPDQYVTAHDLARIAEHLIVDDAAYYPLYAQRDFTWNKIRQSNTNPLLDMGIGADGLKTGYLEEAGYGLVGSAVQDGQRLIVVVTGAKSEKERSEEARKLLQWGFTAFEKVSYFKPGDVIAEARVFGGEKGSVSIVSKEPISLLLPKDTQEEVDGRVVYRGPVQAPVAAGQEIGTLQLSANDQVLREAKVYAANDVKPGDFRERLVGNLRELLFGWWY
ncbi:MAG TPA: D-alanyl-D-alanine carboxypeptidase family protein, partial [Bauldia sp.]|nr:D-alanyl-D-alanine carboxypeptidase family protein [Bauldia sp.]